MHGVRSAKAVEQEGGSSREMTSQTGLCMHLQTVNTFGLFCLLHLHVIFKDSLAAWNIFACNKSSQGLSWLQNLALKKYHQNQVGN